MYFTIEELDEVIWQLEGGFPEHMEVSEYLDFIDILKANRKIQQDLEDEQLASTLI